MQAPDPHAAALPAPDAAQARHILALLRDDDVDAAIAAGLAAFLPLPALGAHENDALAEARDRLLAAWAARGRYRARARRLQRIADERARARAVRQVAEPSPAPGAGADAASPSPASSPSATASAPLRPAAPALPPAAAAALARARARVAGGGA